MRTAQTEAFEAGLIGEIRAWMGRRGYNQKSLAAAMGREEVWVGRRMRGKIKISAGDMHEFARTLDCGVADLLPRLDSNQQPSGSRFALLSGGLAA